MAKDTNTLKRKRLDQGYSATDDDNNADDYDDDGDDDNDDDDDDEYDDDDGADLDTLINNSQN